MTSRIIGLADGSMTLLPRVHRAALEASKSRGMSSSFSLIDAPPAPQGNWVKLEPYTLSDAYINELGESLERLASMALARKLKSPAPIDDSEARIMVGLAGVPNTRAGQMLTDRILTASAEELGKGGIIGSISSAVSKVAKTVVAPVAKVMSTVAPILKIVPVIGPALSTAVSTTANLTTAIAGGSIKSLTAGGVTGTLQRVVGYAGAAVGAGVAISGAVGEGIAEAPQTIYNDVAAVGQWAGGVASDIGGYLGGVTSSGGGMLSTIMTAGRGLVGSFDSSVVASIESLNPRLSGELTSIFQGLGQDYHEFGQVFDTWSAQLKASPANSVFTGKIAGQLYTMVKDGLGKMSVTKTPVQNAPPAVNSIPDGRLVTPSQLAGYGNPVNPAGSGAPMGSDGRGMPVNPAGISLPGGPISASNDPTSLRILGQAIDNANAGKDAASPMLAGIPTWAVAGLGVAALAMLLKGRSSGPMMDMGQGWQMPVRRSSRRRGRK